jgi:hypothetical protein
MERSSLQALHSPLAREMARQDLFSAAPIPSAEVILAKARTRQQQLQANLREAAD